MAYCRGPYCAYAHEAVRQLHAAGRSARRLEEGWPEWRLAASTERRHDDDIPVDVDVLREEIRKTYTDVSTDHDAEFIFPTGRWWAEELGYPQPELGRVPDATVESFAGVGNPGRSAASNRARSCSTSAAGPAPTC